MTGKREDIFRLPPLTMDEAKVVNTILQLNLGRVEDHPCNPELRRKVKILDQQISAVMDLLGKRIKDKQDEYPGTVVEMMTAEEYYERDWEDTDDFDESKRGSMRVNVRWDPDEAGEYASGIEKGYEPEDLVVIGIALPDHNRAEAIVLGMAKRILGEGATPTIASVNLHPKNGWLVEVDTGNSTREQFQVTDNECDEVNGLTVRHVTPRG